MTTCLECETSRVATCTYPPTVPPTCRKCGNPCTGGHWVDDDDMTPENRAAKAEARVRELEALINTPPTASFLEAVSTEAAHQVERWGTEHDDGKSATDWFWLIGFLGGKAVWAAAHGDREKALHHIITTAACCLNWHRRLTGENDRMRPGIATPEVEAR